MKNLLSILLGVILLSLGGLQAQKSAIKSPPVQADPCKSITTPEFDPLFYANKYPDLKSAFGTDCAQLKAHWDIHGLKEGRQSSAYFSVKDYLNRYEDLQNAFGKTNYKAALQHWFDHGKQEGRNAGPATPLPASPKPEPVANVAAIQAIGIANSNDHVYVWYSDGKASSGTTDNFRTYIQPYDYSAATGQSPSNIIGIDIASGDRIYTWYANGTCTVGNSSDLDAIRSAYGYSLPPGKSANSIVGIGIAKSNDHTYVWYNDGTCSSGTTDDLDKHAAPYRYSVPPGKSPSDIVGIAIAGNDRVYAWYKDGTCSVGTTDDLDKYRACYPYAR